MLDVGAAKVNVCGVVFGIPMRFIIHPRNRQAVVGRGNINGLVGTASVTNECCLGPVLVYLIKQSAAAVVFGYFFDLRAAVPGTEKVLGVFRVFGYKNRCRPGYRDDRQTCHGGCRELKVKIDFIFLDRLCAALIFVDSSDRACDHFGFDVIERAEQFLLLISVTHTKIPSFLNLSASFFLDRKSDILIFPSEQPKTSAISA